MPVSAEGFFKKHLTNVVEWQRMGAAGIFSPENRLELINGEIVEMTPIGSRHAACVNRLNQVLTLLVSNQAIVSVQNPLQLDDLSEPEPDLMLLRSQSDFYSSGHPQADDVLLLIEVADQSLSYDQNQKLRLYAQHNIPEYWLLNINDARLEVYRQPGDGVYSELSTLRAGDEIGLSQLDNISIKLVDIF